MFHQSKKYKANEIVKDDARTFKMFESQQQLLEAAKSTADMANIVTKALKGKLDDSKKKYDYTVKNIKDAILICSIDGEIKGANPSAHEIYNKNLIGTNIKDLIFVNDKELECLDIWELLSLDDWKNPKKTNIYGLRNNGEKFFMEPKIEFITWSDLNEAIIVIIKDISSEMHSFCDGIVISQYNFDK